MVKDSCTWFICDEKPFNSVELELTYCTSAFTEDNHWEKSLFSCSTDLFADITLVFRSWHKMHLERWGGKKSIICYYVCLDSSHSSHIRNGNTVPEYYTFILNINPCFLPDADVIFYFKASGCVTAKMYEMTKTFAQAETVFMPVLCYAFVHTMHNSRFFFPLVSRVNSFCSYTP